jgi:hypothetical protein
MSQNPKHVKNYKLKPDNGAASSPPFMVRLATLGLLAFMAASPAQSALIHRYELNGSFADALGGPSLVPGGANGLGTLNATGYAFGPDQGLSLSNALPNNAGYSILVDFSIADTTDFRRIIDFKNLTVDDGLYNHDTSLNFFPASEGAGPAGTFQADVLARLVITRDSATGEFKGYVNGVAQFGFVDSPALSVFDGPNSVIQFFNDNIGSGDTTSGIVDRIEVYDSPLSFAQVSSLGGPAPVPEPSVIVLAGMGLAALTVACRRRRSRRVC